MEILCIKDEDTDVKELHNQIRASLEAIGFQEILDEMGRYKGEMSYMSVYESKMGSAIVRCYEEPIPIPLKEIGADGLFVLSERYRAIVLLSHAPAHLSGLEALLHGNKRKVNLYSLG